MMNDKVFTSVSTKEKKEKISQECWKKALDKTNPM